MQGMKFPKVTLGRVVVTAGILVVLGCGSGALVEDQGSSTGPTSAATAKPKGAPVIEEGQWTVGVDFPAGKYRTAEAITPDQSCYWAITKAGSNGNNIISNDIPTGGKPTVTLAKGQEFTNQGCGVFVKVG